MTDNEKDAILLSPDMTNENQLWPGDQGEFDLMTRKAFLQLVRGPLLTEENNSNEWQALLDNIDLIKSRLANLFLDLVINYETGLAFVKNASSEDVSLPKAVRTLPLTLADTIMLLHLRRELLADSNNRVIIGREELLTQLANYRPVARLDEAAFRKRLASAWSKFVKSGILQPLDSEERCEISPVLSLLFGADEVRALSAEYEQLITEAASSDSQEPGNTVRSSTLASENTDTNDLLTEEEDTEDDD